MTWAKLKSNFLTLNMYLFCWWMTQNMRSTCRQGVLNKWLKRDFHQLNQFCAENCHETFRAKTVEIWQMAINLQRNCIENCLDQDLTSDEIQIITNYLHLNCAEYGLQEWFNPLQCLPFKRLTYRHSVIKNVNLNHCKWWNSCISFRHIT